ncbi:MAG: alpha/beta hydrolase-fold protein [Chloroflexota bacterium]
MIRRALAVVGAAALLALAGPGQQAVSLAHASFSPNVSAYAAPAEPAVRASVLTTYLGGSTVVEHPLFASTLGLSTSYNVFLPAGYEASAQRYPVLYMLHGVAGDATEWQSIGLLEAADRLIQDGQIEPMLIVLPNGGANYWVNHADGARWGDYLVNDVVASVDREYRTIPNRAGRAVGGLSMGGEGALRMAMLNPDVFGIAGAHSPSLRTAYDQLSPELQQLYGTEANWRAASGLWLATDTDAAARLTISLDVGQDDPWRPNVELLHARLDARGVQHRFEVLPGEHAAEYWIGNVDHYLSFYAGAFASAI